MSCFQCICDIIRLVILVILSVTCSFLGSAGQSFACFLTPGMNIRLVGEANDYVGKVTCVNLLIVILFTNCSMLSTIQVFVTLFLIFSVHWFVLN